MLAITLELHELQYKLVGRQLKSGVNRTQLINHLRNDLISSNHFCRFSTLGPEKVHGRFHTIDDCHLVENKQQFLDHWDEHLDLTKVWNNIYRKLFTYCCFIQVHAFADRFCQSSDKAVSFTGNLLALDENAHTLYRVCKISQVFGEGALCSR